MIIVWKGFKIKVKTLNSIVINYSCEDMRALEEYFMLTKKQHKKETIFEIIEQEIKNNNHALQVRKNKNRKN